MKRNIKNMAFALLTLFAVTSCDLLEIDNYDVRMLPLKAKS